MRGEWADTRAEEMGSRQHEMKAREVSQSVLLGANQTILIRVCSYSGGDLAYLRGIWVDTRAAEMGSTVVGMVLS
jgi:hypothetical protein